MAQDKVFKRLTVKVFLPGNKKARVQSYRAAKGKGYTEEGVSELLHVIAENVTNAYPGHEYGLVALAGDQFNFVHRAYPNA